MEKPLGAASIILEKYKKPEQKEEESDSSVDKLDSAMEDFLSAIKANSVDDLKAAFKAAFDMCDSGE